MPDQALRVLLVEDNLGDARLIHWMLQPAQARFELVVADSLSAALARLDDESFSVVLLDLSLPDSQGLETFRTVWWLLFAAVFARSCRGSRRKMT